MCYIYCHMNINDLGFLLTKIDEMAFTNPFGGRRDQLETEILARLGRESSASGGNQLFTRDFNQVLRWIRIGEERLLQGVYKEFVSGSGVERLASLAYFSLYHELVEDLDRLFEDREGNPVLNRKLFGKIERGIRKRVSLTSPARNPLWENPAHLFACFYQLRRAFQCISREIVGTSKPVRDLRVRVWESVFTQDMLGYQQWMHESVGKFPTLVTGPTGSGKEVVARAIGLSRFIPYDAQSGQFASQPRESFRPVNLSALTETLIESELFGHRKGSFTGAIRDRPGIFKSAGRYGTVFLDEIGEVPESIQVKLLRILQSGEFQSIGEEKNSFFEGKIIAATHRDMKREVRKGRIREDFFYRICGDQVNTVALKDIVKAQPAEIAKSVRFICSKLFGDDAAEELSLRVVDRLGELVPNAYQWPGNFRELEQAVRNVIVRNEFVPVELEDSPCEIERTYLGSEVSLDKWNQLYAAKAYENFGSYREAARRLQVDQRTLKKWATEVSAVAS